MATALTHVDPSPRQFSRKGGNWDESDYDIFDGERCTGRIFLDANHTWFWGVSFQLTGLKSYGHAATLDEAKAGFRAEYETWKGTKDWAAD
jgi:hypothetical protein